MTEHAYRLGDLIDDYCPRCRLPLNHAVAGMVDGKVMKVVCETCHTEHPYRQGEGGKKKAPSGRTVLFDQVLSKTTPAPAPSPEPSQDGPPAQKQKKAGDPARYIPRRHKSKPPRQTQ